MTSIPAKARLCAVFLALTVSATASLALAQSATGTTAPDATATPSGSMAEPQAATDPEHNPLVCPTKDFYLDAHLPKNAQPEISLDPSTLWQPRGGEIKIIIRKWPAPLTQASFAVCFRWRHLDGFKGHILPTPIPPRVISSDGQQMVIAVAVPSLASAPPRLWALFANMDDVLNPNVEPHYGDYTAFNGVPIADVMVRVHDYSGNSMDGRLQVGVTSRSTATIFTIVLASLMMLCLYKIRWIEDRFGDVNFLLRVISGPNGRASLSQLQIVVWSLVVGGGAIYVMTLTGELISITQGTLIMLGISGGAALTAEIKGRGNQQGAPPPQAPAPAAAPAADAPAPAEAPANAPEPAAEPAPAPATAYRRPHWADVVTDTTGTEIDVTRVQMLFFTVVTALFVTIKIITSYTIPEIPEGFLILMGISNGVYVSKKFI